MKYLRWSSNWAYIQIGTDGKHVELLNIFSGSISNVTVATTRTIESFKTLDEVLDGCKKTIQQLDRDFYAWHYGDIGFNELKRRKNSKYVDQYMDKPKKKKKKKLGISVSGRAYKEKVDFFMGF